jgi:hypothetical protein
MSKVTLDDLYMHQGRYRQEIADMTEEQQLNNILGEKEAKKVAKLDTVKAKELYDQGMSDNAIGKACGVSGPTMAAWRKKEYLPAIPQKFAPHKKPASLEGRKPAKENPEFEAAFQEMVAGTEFEGNMTKAELPVKLEPLPPVPKQQMTVDPEFEQAVANMETAIDTARRSETKSPSAIALTAIRALVVDIVPYSSSTGITLAKLLLIKEIAAEVL